MFTMNQDLKQFLAKSVVLPAIRVTSLSGLYDITPTSYAPTPSHILVQPVNKWK